MKSALQKTYAGLPELPIDACMEKLLHVLRTENSAVLVAPPGAGKTSRVPLALLHEPWRGHRRILVLEPRRLAARAAAEHMASLIREKPGVTIGYRVRMDSCVSSDTRIEFITEGVFTRMILDDPELSDVACICFDEFHERNLEGDLGLALARDVQLSLRNDLRILPMSATLDGAAVAEILGDAAVIRSEGRSYPVEIRYQPRRPEKRLEQEMAGAVRTALREDVGSLLCFLPGQGEIHRTIENLQGLPDNVDVHALYGAMKPQDQRAAISPAAEGRRKVVLATSIAQTSLTLDGVTIVIDCGLARVSRHEPATGLNRLETVRASRAAIDQRAGRAGRTRPGICIRLWHQGQTNSLPDQERPEILDAELSSLVLDLADWGIQEPASLSWLDLPPKPAWETACKTLKAIGALDDENRITPSGKNIRNMPLPPRLAHMVDRGRIWKMAEPAARLALLVTERGAGGNDIDLAARLENLPECKDQLSRRVLAGAAPIAKSAKSGKARQPTDQESHTGQTESLSPGALLSFAWPERIAKRMGPADVSKGHQSAMTYLLSNGRRAVLDAVSPLAREEWLAICEMQGSAASARILSAATLQKHEIETLHGDAITTTREVSLQEAGDTFKANLVMRLGSIVMARKPTTIAPEDNIAGRIVEHVRASGLKEYLSSGSAASLRNRLALLHSIFPDRFAAVDDDTLENTLEEWLAPLLTNASSLLHLSPETFIEGLKLHSGYENMMAVDRLAPKKMTLPSGIAHSLEYSPDGVTLRAKVQEFYGLSAHPAICEGRVPVVLEFLSPAMRPVQKTIDISGFWAGSWQDVRKDMRGRYPKHFWPDDPANEKATTRTRPRS